MMQSCLFHPFLNPLFITAIYWRFSTGPVQTRKQFAQAKTCFSFKIKDQRILFQLAVMLKNNLRLFKVDWKTLLVCHNAITSTKWQNMKATPNFDPFRRYFSKNYSERPFYDLQHRATETSLAQIITRQGKKVFQNLILVVL